MLFENLPTIKSDLDGTEVSYEAEKIPLYLFGFLYSTLGN